jgi:hypothetical protein
MVTAITDSVAFLDNCGLPKGFEDAMRLENNAESVASESQIHRKHKHPAAMNKPRIPRVFNGLCYRLH